MTDDVIETAAQTPAAVGDTTEGNRIVPNMSAAIPPEEVARITAEPDGKKLSPDSASISSMRSPWLVTTISICALSPPSPFF